MAYPRNARTAIIRGAALSVAVFAGTAGRRFVDHHDIRIALTEGAIQMMIALLVVTPVLLLVTRRPRKPIDAARAELTRCSGVRSSQSDPNDGPAHRGGL
ncbi:hypothetical protein [Sphaerisporangium fuscum]|uniref:hypothetical protein n=1 Tax=Sphaerisporangium fuscum TaxID=2835868 RepID=UPI001BDCE284|nr:hypothetical protein [Sphaerisporangium fuscum]